MSRSHKQAGFTILELMIATMVFSVILLLVTYGIIQIGNRYYKATLQSQTQTAVRNAVDEITRSLQFSGGPITSTTSGNSGAYCVNGTQYIYVLHEFQVPGNHIFYARPDPGGCVIPASYPTDARDLLSNRMRIANFSIGNVGSNAHTFRVTLRVTSGEDDLLCSPGVSGDCNTSTTSTNLNNPDLMCKGQAGSQYCAVSELSTVVTQRLSQ